MTDYEGFSCAYYDELALLSMRKIMIDIYTKTDTFREVTIVDLITKEGEEFAVLSNEQSVRLDLISSITELVSGRVHNLN